MLFETIAFFSLMGLMATIALAFPDLKNRYMLLRYKDAKIVVDFKANKNASIRVIRPEGNALKYGVHAKTGIKIDTRAIYIDEKSGRHLLVVDEAAGTTIDPVKIEKGAVTAQLIEQLDREAAEIALMERAGQEDRLIKMMWLVVGASCVVLLGVLAVIYITSGNSGMLGELLARAPVG